MFTTVYNVEEELNSWADDDEVLSLSGKGLTAIHSILRFKKAKYLNVNHNYLTELPELPKTLKRVVAHTNYITRLPTLPKGLHHLKISDNQLTQLPPLPKGLHTLEVSNNPLQSLPRLPATLRHLDCDETLITELPQLPDGLEILTLCRNHHLTALPVIPDTVHLLYLMDTNVWSMKNIPVNHCHIQMEGTPIYEEILKYTDDEDDLVDVAVLRARLQTLNRFRELYYALRFKQKFRDFLWMRVRLPRIERANHPDELKRVLRTEEEEEESEDDGGLEKVMETFGM